MPFSDTYANNILNWMFGKGAITVNSHPSVYIGLCTNDPEADGGWDTTKELSGNGYTRVLISKYGESYPNVISSASGREITNPYQINWYKATADWPEANGFGLFTTISGGTPYFYGKLDNPVTCETGAVALFDPNTLKISFPTTDISEAAATSE